MKQAASRPRPPLPSAASGSSWRISARSTPRAESFARRLGQAEIVQPVHQQAADQELDGEVVDLLAAGLVAAPRRAHPAVDDAVAHGQRQRHEPVARARGARVLADGVDQLGQDRLAQLLAVRRRHAAFHGLGLATFDLGSVMNRFLRGRLGTFAGYQHLRQNRTAEQCDGV